MTDELHPATRDLVSEFADAVAKKLLASQQKHGWTDDWSDVDWRARCQEELQRHVEKGDPLDVAAYAAFCWHHGWPTAERKA